MLQQLDVKNFAIIEHSKIKFNNGFVTITGETGAGKSILLGALSLILGNRADKKSILDSSKKSVIEGTFIIGRRHQSFFKKHDLDFDTETVVRREISPSGKSRAFINDTPVTLDILKQFTSQLIDLHRQHESLSITTAHFQRELVDIYSNSLQQASEYHTKYNNYKANQQQLQQLKEQQATAENEKDFISFQVNELVSANLQANELETIEIELNKLENSEELLSGIESVKQLLGEEQSSISLLQTARQEFKKLITIDDSFTDLYNRIDSCIIELEDIEKELNHFDNVVEHDPERISVLKERTDILNRLMSKHHVQTDAELIALQTLLEEKLAAYEISSEEIIGLTKQIAQQEQELWQLAEQLHKKRLAVKEQLEQTTEHLLHSVGMEKAKVQFSISKLEELTPFGCSSIELLFTPNVGQQPQPLKNVASGGELSRLMLALKTLIADKTTLPTMIFDEIDTGISGEVAMKVGDLLRKLAEKHQIISITHLPQIAAKGHHQLKVYKNDATGVTRSNVKELNQKERVQEIAQMLFGENPSEGSLQTARELLG